jgi:CheY-like chemotaxis protein
MPYMSGYELVEALKADSATWHIPVIFLTSDRHVEEHMRMLRAEACLKKPLDTRRLLELVALFTIATDKF